MMGLGSSDWQLSKSVKYLVTAWRRVVVARQAYAKVVKPGRVQDTDILFEIAVLFPSLLCSARLLT
jgi:hypothetical protein